MPHMANSLGCQGDGVSIIAEKGRGA